MKHSAAREPTINIGAALTKCDQGGRIDVDTTSAQTRISALTGAPAA